MSDSEKGGEKQAGELNPNRNAQRQRKGTKLNAVALWTFSIVQSIYLVFGGFSIFMMITGWEKVTDFENDVTNAIETSGDVQLPPIDGKARMMYIMATGICVILNVLMLFSMRWMAGIYVWLGPAMLTVYVAAGAGLAAMKGATGMALIYGSFVPLIGLYVWLMRGRFVLGKYLLSTAGTISSQATNVFGAVFVNLFVQSLLVVLNVFAIIGCFLVFQPGHEGCGTQTLPCSWAIAVGGCFYLVLAHLWLSAVVSNLFLVALAGGPFSKFYFQAPRGERGTFRALRLAIRHSVGSIAFGTLLVGLVQLLDGIFGSIAQATDNPIAAAIACLFSCFLSILESLLETFNKSIGKRDDAGQVVIDPFEETYWEAAVHCVGFIKRRPKRDKKNKKGLINSVARSHGISSLVNDDITGMALVMAGFATATLCAIVTFLYIFFVNDRVIADHWYDWVAVAYAFVLGLTIGLVTTSALEVGVSTLFVCMSDDIKYLETLNPEFECWIRWKYPDMFSNIARVPPGQPPPALGGDAKIEFKKKFDHDGSKGSGEKA